MRPWPLPRLRPSFFFFRPTDASEMDKRWFKSQLFGRNRENKRREADGRRNWPEAVPRKMRGRKRVFTEISENRGERWTRTNQRRNSFVAQRHKGIHAHAPAGGQIARRHGHRHK
jgi:hypothetical protein